MEELTQENAKKYALENLKKLDDINYQWNLLHSEAIIEILKILTENRDIEKERLIALAWIHDIGKIKSDENHAEIGLEILKGKFELNETDKDCILNHGSSSKPKTEQGEIFHYADGLSLFMNKTIRYRLYAEAKEGKDFEQINDIFRKMYKKYRESYSDSKQAINLLNKLFNDLNI